MLLLWDTFAMQCLSKPQWMMSSSTQIMYAPGPPCSLNIKVAKFLKRQRRTLHSGLLHILMRMDNSGAGLHKGRPTRNDARRTPNVCLLLAHFSVWRFAGGMTLSERSKQ